MTGKIKMIVTMLIFGSVGLFVKNINLSSSEIALLRGVIGCITLIAAGLLINQTIRFRTTKKNIMLLCLSGGALGFNWMFLFEAYRYTTISNATISYYFAPIFVMILAPFILKEKMARFKVGSIIAAIIGIFFIVGIDNGDRTSQHHVMGVFFGLLAAAFYASVMFINKFIRNLSDQETTIGQLAMASIVILPYVFVTEGLNVKNLDIQSLLFILIVGILHTGFAYMLYFSALKQLDGQRIALYSYIDPIFAIVLSALLLNETFTFIQAVGGTLILGATFINEQKNARLVEK
ncbi:DMT family transporter [Pallidibacillus thermolactis]|uniref:DMT family transporter n=1 Tax=Pallidibacillus thermolactis TaxID=251051 RepID=UPI00156B49FF|nr:DMT family transporter [Pallidibacillus thermolactis]MCU9601216.1 DMT family transporter [Pallidibacillus thermolactis subsp. kokeshiiformis]